MTGLYFSGYHKCNTVNVEQLGTHKFKEYSEQPQYTHSFVNGF